jgi:hypothetical protein
VWVSLWAHIKKLKMITIAQSMHYNNLEKVNPDERRNLHIKVFHDTCNNLLQFKMYQVNVVTISHYSREKNSQY